MKRTIALLVGVAAACVAAAAPAVAAPGAPGNTTPTYTVPADAVTVSLSQVAGSGLAVTLDPGASEEHDLVVSNHTANLRLTIKLSATDATGNLGTSAASWLSFGDDVIQLDPHVATTVPMTVAVPHDTQPGSALAHVSATVQSAVAAADGSPVAGTASQTFPVSIAVTGTPTAQIAIADVHRVDQGSTHQLALVLRNFGVQGTNVSGHVIVAGDHPQTLPFHADLAASRDTTVDLGWNAPPVGTASDIAVDLEYGGGNVASWSSRLGGAPTGLATSPNSAGPSATTAPVAQSQSTTSSASVSPSKPWWKQPFVTVLAVLALLGAGLWFGFEMKASRRRRDWVPGSGHAMMPVGWVPAASDESIDLAKQLVRLTDVIVQLVSTHRDGMDISDERARARSPDLDPADADSPPLPVSRFETHELRDARAGPAPPDLGPPGDPTLPFPEHPEIPRSASVTASDVPRPEPVAELVAPAFDDAEREPLVDLVAGLLEADIALEAQLVAEAALEPEARAVPVDAGSEEPPIGEPPVDDDGDDEPPVDDDVRDDEVVDEEVIDPQVAMMQRIVELDRERRRLREWMDAEDSGQTIEPDEEWFVATDGSDDEVES